MPFDPWMRAVILVVVALFLAGCVAEPEGHGGRAEVRADGTNVCARVEAPTPSPIVTAGRTLWPSSATPGSSGTPTNASPPLDEDGWDVYQRRAGSHFHETGLREAVIRDEDAWECFWRATTGGSSGSPPIDFSKDAMLVITLGPQETLGHSIHPIGVREGDEGYLVEFAPVRPGTDCHMGDEYVGSPAPLIILRHRPQHLEWNHTFVEQEARVWECEAIVGQTEPGRPISFNVTVPGESRMSHPYGETFEHFNGSTVMVLNESRPWHPYLGEFFTEHPEMEDSLAEGFFLVATLGSRGNMEHTISIRSIEWASGTFQVRLDETSPGAGCAVSPLVTAPYLVAWVERVDDQSPQVEASLETERVDCE